jgi:RNA polymerase sigma factor (sigma-70 family)
MDDDEWLASQFERQRSRLRAVAYQMLGSHAEADDAVQDAWLRLSRSGTTGIVNLDGWLTTIVARVSLNALRSRNMRREEPLSVHIPDPVISLDEQTQPEDEALLADSVGLALLIVLDTLTPDERLAFVLHDMFQLPFEEIAALTGRTPASARQLASRARRRVKGAELTPDSDLSRRRQVVDAFFRAARRGDFDGLLTVLHPDVQLRTDAGARTPAASILIRGSAPVARQVVSGLRIGVANQTAGLVHVLVNGSAGAIITVDGQPFIVLGFAITGGKIVSIEAIADPARVSKITAAIPQRR